MEFIGNLVQNLGIREGDSARGHWRSASYLLQTVEAYPKHIVIDYFERQQGGIDYWDSLIGKNVAVQFDIDARESNGRWFNTLKGWAIKENGTQGQVMGGGTGWTAPQGAGTTAQGAGSTAQGAGTTAKGAGSTAQGAAAAAAQGQAAPAPSQQEKDDDDLPF